MYEQIDKQFYMKREEEKQCMSNISKNYKISIRRVVVVYQCDTKVDTNTLTIIL